MSEEKNEGLKKVLYTGVGIAAVSADAIGKAVDTLAAKGEEAVQKGRVMNEELKRKRAVTKANIKDVADALEEMTKEEVEAMRAKISDIEKTMAEAGKSVKMDAATIAAHLEKMGRDEIDAVKAKIEEIRKNWTDDDGDKGDKG